MRSPKAELSNSGSAWMTRLHVPLLLLALTALLYLPGTGTIPLMDRDEPRFAHATVEMMQRGTWTVPYFNGEYRFDKPPLTYWWMRLHYALLGVSELSARLHSVVAVWLVSLVVFAVGKRLRDTKAAWWGAFAWLTSFQALVHGRLCVADMPMVLCVALSLWSLLELLSDAGDPPRRFSRWWWTLWLSLGMGFLAKGPIAILVPALALTLWRFIIWRKPVAWSRLQAGWGVVVALAPVAAWGIPALVETHGLFWKIGMGEHVVKRGTAAFNGRVVIPGYYLVTAFISLLPWIAFLPRVIAVLRRNWSADTALLVAWFAAPQLIFLFYATQLPHYTMPGFPAFFVLLGYALAEEQPRLGAFAGSLLGGMALLALALLGVSLGGGIVSEEHLRLALASVAVVLGSLAALGLAACLRSRPGMLLPCAAIALALVPLGNSLREAHPAAQLAPQWRALPEDASLVAWQFTEPGLVFYADRKWTMLSKLERVEERIARSRADAVVLLVREWTLADAWKHLGSKDSYPPTHDFSREVEALTRKAGGFRVEDVRGLNLARSSWVEVRVLLRRDAARPAQASTASSPASATSSVSGPSGPSPSRVKRVRLTANPSGTPKMTAIQMATATSEGLCWFPNMRAQETPQAPMRMGTPTGGIATTSGMAEPNAVAVWPEGNEL